MKNHMIYNIYFLYPEPDDGFRTWCGISDIDNPSEELMKNHLVNDWEDCTCKKCKKAYEKHIKRFEEGRICEVCHSIKSKEVREKRCTKFGCPLRKKGKTKDKYKNVIRSNH